MNKSPSKLLRIALVQMRCEEDPARNLETAMNRIRAAAAEGAKVACLPELFLGPYFCQTEDVRQFDRAEPIPGPTTERMSALARELGVVLIVPIFERRAAGVYHNSAVVIDADGRLAGHYRKMHIPDDPLFYEKFYFTPGDLGFRTATTRHGKIGVLICWDQWFPEAARLTALGGADVLFYPTAIGWTAGEKETQGVEQHSAWETVQRGHAIANGVFVAACNRVGNEGELEFWGRSFLAGPMGTVLVRADESEAVVVADLDLAAVDQTRRIWPFLRDRRIDAYGGLDRRLLDSP